MTRDVGIFERAEGPDSEADDAPPQRRSVAGLAREIGIPEAAVYTWRIEARKAGAVMPSGGGNKTEAWNSTSKFAMVLESMHLNEEELSAYCRGKRAHVERLQSWCQACKQANAERGETQSTAHVRSLNAERRRNQEIEQDLRPNEKARAQAAALLMRKKYRALPPADVGL